MSQTLSEKDMETLESIMSVLRVLTVGSVRLPITLKEPVKATLIGLGWKVEDYQSTGCTITKAA